MSSAIGRPLPRCPTVGRTELNAFCNGNANHDLVHDKVVAICPRDGTVTLEMTLGCTFSKPILYLSIEDMGAKGYIRSLDGGDLRAVGFIVNCPVVYRVN